MAYWHNKTIRSGVVGLICGLWLALTVTPTLAQAPEVIGVGENTLGTVNAVSPTPAYVFPAGAGQTITVQVLSITPEFSPAVNIFDASGTLIEGNSNLEGQSGVELVISTDVAAAYTIQIASANGQEGQFVLSLQEGVAEPAAPPETLQAGQALTGSVDAANNIVRYSFSSSPTETLVLSVDSNLPLIGPLVTVLEASNSETLGTVDPRLIGGSFSIPPGTGAYLVTVEHAGNAAVIPFMVALQSASAGSTAAQPQQPAQAQEPQLLPTVAPVATPEVAPPTQAPLEPAVLPTSGPCVAATAGQQAANIRGGAGQNFESVGALEPSQIATVTGRSADGLWYQLQFDGVTGFAAEFVLRFGGDDGACDSLPPAG